MTWIYPTKAPLPEDYFGYKKKTEDDDEYEITITKYTYKKKKKKKGVSMPANDWFIQHVLD